VQSLGLVRLVTRQLRIDCKREEVIGGKAHVYRLQIVQRPYKQTGAYKQDQAHAHLHRNRDPAEAQCPSRSGYRLLLQRWRQIRTPELNRRSNAEDQAHDQRQPEVESQYMQIWLRRKRHDAVGIGKCLADEQRRCLGSNGQTEHSAQYAEQQSFTQQLLDDPTAARTHGVAHRHLLHPRSRAHKQQRGYIHRRHHRHQEHHRHHDQHRRPVLVEQ
jgi:hypothetical protein